MLTATKTSSIDTATNTNWQVDPVIKTNKQIKNNQTKTNWQVDTTNEYSNQNYF